MPKYKTHLSFGFLTFFIVFFILNFINISNNYIFLYLGACLLGSLFPDIDTKSMIQKFFYFFLFFVVIWAIFIKNWQIAAFIGLLALIPMIVNHRKLTHRIWFVIIVPFFIPIIVYHYNKNMLYPAFFSYVFFVCGAVSHIWLDFGIKRSFRRK
ncbi:hypothetical protein GF385_01145 [Candidatus Dependentiae bacterium]|nr:hypothetical protein [Candidatus Dependentiae bacterium]